MSGAESRQWQPGDVALVDHPGYRDTPKQAIVRPRRDANGALEFAYIDGGFDMCDSRDLVARPLVVIDPEDREQVERLTKTFWRVEGVTDWSTLDAEDTDTMQAALREFADPQPPKPDEPSADGATVECDYDGKHGRAVLLGGSWTFYGEALRDHGAIYAEFENVTVLSEGLTA